MRAVKVVLFLATALLQLAGCDEHDHKYEEAEEVVLWMNTVGPYHNRQETYGYFTLPFCRGMKEEISHYHETIGEALQVKSLNFHSFFFFCILILLCVHTFVLSYSCISVLQGTELEFSGLAIEFRVDTAKTTYCQVCQLSLSPPFNSGSLTFLLIFLLSGQP